MFLKQIAKRFSTIKYTKHHQWVQYISAQKRARIGITNYAQQQLGEIVYVEMPQIGKQFKADDQIGTIQSVKIAAQLYTPITGKVIQVNNQLSKEASYINSKPYNAWIVDIICKEDPQGLMTKQEYEQFINREQKI